MTDLRKHQIGKVEVVCNIGQDGDAPTLLGFGLFDMTNADGSLVPPERLARLVRDAWEKASKQVEDTVSLFGFEGIVRRAQEGK